MKSRKNMTSILLFAILSFGLASQLLGASEIANLIVRQRWPWSPVVDIDFVLTGTNSASVRFFGQYNGKEKFELQDKDIGREGAAGDFAPGPHHVTWDPVKAGLNGEKREGFRIVAEITTYLVLDLSDGSYIYMAEPPEGGWLENPEYFKTKMVFRRIPAGTKNIGLNDGLREKLGFTQSYTIQRAVTMSSDYYLAVYPTTKAQHDFVVSKKDVSAYAEATYCAPCVDKYDDLRGSVGDGIDWPKTMYSVKEDCVVDKYRKVVAHTFPADWRIDLPTASQWEYACRATTPDDWLWSVGGTANDTDDVLKGFLDKIATWGGNISTANPNKLVGRHSPNGWGLYDMIGLCSEWNLDWFVSNYQHYEGIDPVGPESCAENVRVRRSNTADGTGLETFSSTFMKKTYSDKNYSYRLCIHLKQIERKAEAQ